MPAASITDGLLVLCRGDRGDEHVAVADVHRHLHLVDFLGGHPSGVGRLVIISASVSGLVSFG